MLKNEARAGQTIATSYGNVTFDQNGESKDLTAAQEKEIAKHPNYTYVAEKQQAPKKEEPVKEEVEEKPKPTRKAPAKKSTSKRTTKKAEDTESGE